MKGVFKAFLAVAVVTAAGSAQAGYTVKFDGLADTEFTYRSSYSEGGFQFTSSESSSFAFATAGTSYADYYAGSSAMLNAYSGGTTTLSKVGGGTFALNSINLSEYWRYYTDVTVSFTGTKADLSTVTHTVTLDGTFGFETVTFSGFTDLVKVEWNQDYQYHQFDDVVLDELVEETPAPPAVILGVIGVASLLGVGRFRRKPTGAVAA